VSVFAFQQLILAIRVATPPDNLTDSPHAGPLNFDLTSAPLLIFRAPPSFMFPPAYRSPRISGFLMLSTPTSPLEMSLFSQEEFFSPFSRQLPFFPPPALTSKILSPQRSRDFQNMSLPPLISSTAPQGRVPPSFSRRPQPHRIFLFMANFRVE